MELFDKIYGCYYQVVAKILDNASIHPITRGEMQDIATQYGFEESALTILPKLIDGSWHMLQDNGDRTWSSVLSHTFKTPITKLQKSWLKALLADPRIHLFFTDTQFDTLSTYLADVSPLYNYGDFYYYDRDLDGDHFSDKAYRERFYTIVTALKQEQFLFVSYAGKKNLDSTAYEVFPVHLQYSSKDDKFRLYGFWQKNNGRLMPIILNLGRILGCHLSKKEKPTRLPEIKSQTKEPVVIEISGQRNSLERCMLHFANYEKHTEYDETRDVYYCSIFYNETDQTELLIQVLSFGPVIKVLGPDSFLAQVKERIKRQHDLLMCSAHESLEHSPIK